MKDMLNTCYYSSMCKKDNCTNKICNGYMKDGTKQNECEIYVVKESK